MQELAYIFIVFLLYSILGWIIEVNLFLITDKKFINRGFLIGPYCPIYGIGVILMYFLLKKYTDDPLVLFVLAVTICSILEYFTSYILEKVYKARWWDYSNILFNLNGRICLINSILFGIGGLIIMYFNPILINFLRTIPTGIFNVITAIIAILFIIDIIISLNIVNKVKNMALSLNKDNTEEITLKISSILKEKTGNIKRLINAFPNAIIYKKKK